DPRNSDPVDRARLVPMVWCSSCLLVKSSISMQRGADRHGRCVGGPAGEPAIQRLGLLGGGLEPHDAGQQGVGTRQALEVPANVLARRAHAGALAIKGVMVLEMLEQAFTQFAIGGRGQVSAVLQVMSDLAKDPRAPLCRASDHDGIRPSV